MKRREAVLLESAGDEKMAKSFEVSVCPAKTLAEEGGESDTSRKRKQKDTRSERIFNGPRPVVRRVL